MARPSRTFGYAAYQTTTPRNSLDRVVSFYDRVLMHISQAIKHDEAGDYEQEFTAVKDAVMVLHALDAMLSPVDQKMYDMLHKTYQLQIRALYSAATRPDGAPHYRRLHESLQELREAWVEVKAKAFLPPSEGGAPLPEVVTAEMPALD